jgi:hypothetical protein
MIVHVLVLFVVTALANATERESNLITWIRSAGGVVSHHHIIRRENPDDPSSLRGIFAVEDIRAGTLLADIPFSAIIGPNNSEGDPNDMCGTPLSLKREMDLGGASFFAPYLKLIDRDPFLPLKYSKKGQQLLLGKILGLSMGWHGDILEWYEKVCGLDIENDPVGVQATLITVTRSCAHNDFDGSLMVPYFDMFNFRGGRYLNTITHGNATNFRVIAWKDIPAGEQLYVDYGTGTIKHLFQYGFVDWLPQTWMFNIPKTEGQSGHTLVFELDEDDETGRRVVNWIEEEPTAEDITFLSTSELDRLEFLQDELLKDAESLPAEEKSVILQFYYSLLFAIKSAIVSAHDEFDLNEMADFDEEAEFEVDDEADFDEEAEFDNEFQVDNEVEFDDDDDDEFDDKFEMNEEL